jgi:hypothetical protein
MFIKNPTDATVQTKDAQGAFSVFSAGGDKREISAR